jgi:2,3-bisphosphoglycerate-independent phosphoglycerate mutase
MMIKTYLVILDGAADRPILSLGRRTPIEAAHTPHLDELAKRGQQGLLAIIDGEICPESDNGAMALLSYDPLKVTIQSPPLT